MLEAMKTTLALGLGFLLSSLLPCSAELSAAASAVDITPDPAAGPVWIAGFGLGRRATGVHDPIMSRALVVSDGKTTVGLVALDLVGLMRPHVERIRKETGKAVDFLVVASTHNHEGPDTMGLWGESPFASGIDPAYVERLVGAVSAQVETLAQQLRPVTLRAVQLQAPTKDYVADSRDPVVIDDTLSAFQLAAPGGRAVATVVNWANHPETLWSRNPLLSADYPGALCRRLEERFGGTGVFFSGALGGMMTPDHRRNEKGEEMHTFEEADRIGRGIADLAADALAAAPAETETALAFRSKDVLIPCTNRRFHLAMGLKLLARETFTKSGAAFEGKISPKNVPYVKTEVGLVILGPVSLALVPGELFPELAVGGYDGSKSFGQPVVKKDSPNPPDLAKAPKGPYLRDLMASRVEMIVGLANDEIGYIVPEYDFQANLKSPTMEPQPEGDHYEETNSLGKRAAAKVMGALEGLLKE